MFIPTAMIKPKVRQFSLWKNVRNVLSGLKLDQSGLFFY